MVRLNLRAQRVGNHIQHESSRNDFIQNVMNLGKVEDEVQLADVFKDSVETFDKDLDQIEDSELAFCWIDDKDKVQRRVVL